MLTEKHGAAPGSLTDGASAASPCPTNASFTAGAPEMMRVEVATAGYKYSDAVAEVGPISLYAALLEGVMRRAGMIADFRTLASIAPVSFAPFAAATGESDLSFPWSQALCARDADACDGALWSDPIFEVTSHIYTLGDPVTSVDLLTADELCVADESRSALMGGAGRRRIWWKMRRKGLPLTVSPCFGRVR